MGDSGGDGPQQREIEHIVGAGCSDRRVDVAENDTEVGQLAESVNRAKRTVKHNPAMFEIAQNLRSMFR